MNVAQWRAEIRVSRGGQLGLIGTGGFILICLYLTRWDAYWWLIKSPVLLGLLVELTLHWYGLKRHYGQLTLTREEVWFWQGQSWCNAAPPVWFGVAVRLSWKAPHRRRHVWLMRDSMSESAWRQLRAYWLMGRQRNW